jgi:hypothetical protein
VGDTVRVAASVGVEVGAAVHVDVGATVHVDVRSGVDVGPVPGDSLVAVEEGFSSGISRVGVAGPGVGDRVGTVCCR